MCKLLRFVFVKMHSSTFAHWTPSKGHGPRLDVDPHSALLPQKTWLRNRTRAGAAPAVTVQTRTRRHEENRVSGGRRHEAVRKRMNSSMGRGV